MKLRIKWTLILASIILFGCDDTTGALGWDLLPGGDILESKTMSFSGYSESVAADSLYARNDYAFVGKFTDLEFGSYEASIISEVNCPINYSFPEVYKYDETTKTGSGTLAGDSIVNCSILLFYDAFYGDSISPTRLNLYKLNDKWLETRKTGGRFYRYTNIDPKEYYNKEDLLGSVTITPYDFSIEDSIRKHTDAFGNRDWAPHIAFPLDKEIGDRIYRLNREHPEYFKNNEAFINNVFPGVVIENEYGDGSVLFVNRVDFDFTLRFHSVDSLGVKRIKKVDDQYGKAGEDSLYFGASIVFSTTNEVIQANRFENSDKIKEKIQEEDWTFIKSPAGIFTQITLPFDEIDEQLAGDSINSVKLSLQAYSEDKPTSFSLGAPEYVMLIRKKDFKTFFEDNLLANNFTNFTTVFSETETNKYVFPNIARLISIVNTEKMLKKQIKGGVWTDEDQETWIDDNKLLLVPIAIIEDGENNGNIINIQHNLTPTNVKLVGGTAKNSDGSYKNPINLEINYTSFKVK